MEYDDTQSEPGAVETLPPDSIMARLRQQRAEIASTHTVPLDIPGYGGELVAMYRLLDSGELTAIAQRANKQNKSLAEKNFGAAVDAIIAACDGMYYRDPETQELTALSNGSGQPFKYDTGLAEYLGIEGANTAREVVVAVFSNDVAILQHQQKLVTWMGDTSKNVDDSLLGEA